MNKAVCSSFLNTNDIQLFIDHYVNLLKAESEVNMNSAFQGEGGVLSLKVQMKPLKLLRTAFFVSSMQLLIYVVIIITLASLAISHKLFTLLIFGCLFLGIFVFSIVSEKIKQLRSLINELKSYGQ